MRYEGLLFLLLFMVSCTEVTLAAHLITSSTAPPIDLPGGISGTTFYIDPNGNDDNSGSQESPWKTFAKPVHQ